MAVSVANLVDETVSAEAGTQGYSVDIVSLRKSFRRHTRLKNSYSTIKTSLIRSLFQRSRRQENCTHAIKDLTIRIPRGSSFGVIGRNGSGKSTLLKLITGIYKPDHGHVKLSGRVSALIELGAGFHPDFTGRENLMLGAVMHGLTKAETLKRFDQIVEFAELKDVIDDPVRTYSSGMFMRLGFSLAVHTDPDILLVDEVLAVGDAGFVGKCKEKIAELRKAGKTLVLVTHDLDSVERWCDEVLWLDRGEARDRGEPRRVIDHYRQFIEKGEEHELREEQQERVVHESAAAPKPADESGQDAARWGSREVEITAIRLCDAQRREKLLFHSGDDLVIEADYRFRDQVSEVVFGIGINRSDGLVVHGTNTDIEKVDLSFKQSGTLKYKISGLGLLEGNYLLDIAVHRRDGYPFDYHKNAVKFAVRSPLRQIGVYLPNHEWESL